MPQTSLEAPSVREGRIHNLTFTRPCYYTAWDFMKDEEGVLKGIVNLLDAGVLPTYIKPYVLVGYDTTIEEDFYRFDTLRELDVEPFVMPYNNVDHPLKRYGQRPAIYKTCTYEEYRKKKEEGSA